MRTDGPRPEAAVETDMADARPKSPPIIDELTALCVARHPGAEVWRPRIFRPTDVEDAEQLARLLRSSPELAVYDQIADQLRELIESRHPERTLQSGELERLVADQLRDRSSLEYGVWVHYPWSRRLVHILDRAEFIELRTNRNRYKITQDEQDLLATRRVGIVGQSVGQSVALTIAMERSAGEIRLADFDTLGLSNLNRLRAGLHNLGVPKVFITAREIAEIDPFIVVKCFPEGVADDAMVEEFMTADGRIDLLIDECDSLDMKVRLRRHARARRIPVLMETSDRCLVDIERYDLEPERPIFHDLLGDFHPQHLLGLSTQDKVPYVLQIIGESTMSDRGRASMVEVGNSIKTWPQLASAVTMGGGIAADVARRMNLGYIRQSGRYWVDVEEIIPDSRAETRPAAPAEAPTPLPAAAMVELAARLPVAARTTLRLTAEQRDRLLNAAILAPSGGNCQPWQWLDSGGRLHLFQDRVRSFALADYQGCGALVGLGAATENLVLAAHQEGLEVRATPFPAGEAEDLVVSFELSAEPGPDTEPHWRDELGAFIGDRHTNRKTGRHRVDAPAMAELRAAVTSIAGAQIQFLEQEEQLAAIGQLVGAGDRIRYLNEDCNRELFKELRWTEEEAQAHRDGISLDSLEMTRTDRAGLKICSSLPSLRYIRAWNGGQGLVKASLKAIVASSAVGLITMPGSRRIDYLQGGRAMQRMWLAAHGLALSIHPMTTLTYMFARLLRGGGEGLDPATIADLARLRDPYLRLFDVPEGAAEVLLFRMARTEPATARALRRPLEDVLVVA